MNGASKMTMAATQSSAVYPDPFPSMWVRFRPSAISRLRFAPGCVAAAFPQMNRLHRQINRLGTEQSFSERSLASLDVKLHVTDTDLSHIPENGPLIVVANHPFGAIDGLALMALIKRRRPDVKMLANYLLMPCRNSRRIASSSIRSAVNRPNSEH